MAGQTEWEDALIKHGIREAPKVEESDDVKQLKAIEARAARDPLAEKSLEELDEVEDEVEDEFLLKYRRARLAQMEAAASKNIFGTLNQISEPEFKEEVTETSKKHWVICLLFLYSQPQSQLMARCLEEFASKFRDVKCVRFPAKECIHNYPDENCPTLIVYHEGDIVGHLKGIERFGGMKMTAEVLEFDMAALGMVKTSLEVDPRIQLNSTFRMVRMGKDRFDSESDSDSD
eukprot:544696_1